MDLWPAGEGADSQVRRALRHPEGPRGGCWGGGDAPAKVRKPEKQEFVLTQSMLIDMYERPAGDTLDVQDEELDVSMKGIALRVGKLLGYMVLSFVVIWGIGYWTFYVGPWSRAGDIQAPLF